MTPLRKLWYECCIERRKMLDGEDNNYHETYRKFIDVSNFHSLGEYGPSYIDNGNLSGHDWTWCNLIFPNGDEYRWDEPL